MIYCHMFNGYNGCTCVLYRLPVKRCSPTTETSSQCRSVELLKNIIFIVCMVVWLFDPGEEEWGSSPKDGCSQQAPRRDSGSVCSFSQIDITGQQFTCFFRWIKVIPISPFFDGLNWSTFDLLFAEVEEQDCCLRIRGQDGQRKTERSFTRTWQIEDQVSSLV